MTIKELKELIANMDDDDLVMVHTEEDTDVVGEYWFNDCKDGHGIKRKAIVLALQRSQKTPLFYCGRPTTKIFQKIFLRSIDKFIFF